MRFVLDIPFIHSIALGMQSVEEVIMNVSLFNGEKVPEDIKKALETRSIKLHIDNWCEGCGKCVERCGQDALRIIDGKVVVDQDKCVLCSYCAGACPQFAIKVC
jgi:ferredoxin